MGLPSLTTSRVCWPCASFRARRTTCTTTRPPSLADPGGAFDTPKQKCPPDRGSSDCVTGSPASIPIPRSHLPSPSSDISTPPLTPDNASPPAFTSKRHNDALDFLMTVFPHNGLSVLPHSQSVAISAPNLGTAFEGVVLSLPGTSKTLYVDGKSAQSVSIRESIVALLDLADESLGCSALVIVLERSSPALGNILHSLMYVGGSVVTKPPFQVDPAFVLVGLEI
ncbi:Smr domain-containing protein [Mycena chlorophos]|uniref:Ornithine decarboxylase antizyme n=1 Tax=Mycena chlorophos TaxID=658473 RepID=A0A8H6W086_MYCCL|nr:Smr domain-containing protein [Mycena chlorophos]